MSPRWSWMSLWSLQNHHRAFLGTKVVDVTIPEPVCVPFGGWKPSKREALSNRNQQGSFGFQDFIIETVQWLWNDRAHYKCQPKTHSIFRTTHTKSQLIWIFCWILHPKKGRADLNYINVTDCLARKNNRKIWKPTHSTDSTPAMLFNCHLTHLLFDVSC